MSQNEKEEIAEKEGGPQECEKIKIHCWDFGGQEIMRATHQLFLSERSVYLVVLNIRKDDNPEHWLKQVMAVSSKSPIIVVLNKCDEQYDDNLTRQLLKEKYPNIVGFFKVSCKDNVGIDKLKKEVIKQVSQLDMRQFVLAQNWLDIKPSLETLKRDKDYISYDKFIEVCKDKGISDPVVQEILLTLLHDLGLVIHFKQLEELQTQVLNPSWITEGIYTLINADKLAKQNGVLSKNDAERILKQKYDCGRYSGKTAYLMQVMQQFELCYEIPKEKPKNSPSYLIPDLLPTELTENPTLDKGIELIYKYDGYMPPELMARFIVKSHALQQQDMAWRYGVFLRSDDFDSSAIVIVDKEDRVIRINVNSGEKRQFMAVIRNFFADIHRTYHTENIGLQEYVSLTKDGKESLIRYSILIKFEQRCWQGEEKDTQYDDVLDVEYSIKEMLDGFELTEKRKESFDKASGKTVISITNNNNSSANQTSSQESNQYSSQQTTVSISIQLQTFCTTLKDWGEETLEDLKESPGIENDESLQKLIPRAEKEINRVVPAIEEISEVVDQEQAQSKVSKFAKVQSFIKDAIEGTNKVGELIDKAGEGVGKLQSMGKEYNKIALKFGLQAIPEILLGSGDS